MAGYLSGPMTTILLARHGESDWNAERRWQGQADRPLTDRGRAQARSLARALALDRLGAVYSSDLARCRETAEIVAAVLGLGVRCERGLREADVGEWSGLTMDEISRRYPEGVRRRQEDGTGWETGETFAAMALRVVEVLVAIAAEHPGERILAVTHGGPMRAVWLASGGAHGDWPRYGNCALEEVAVESGRIGRIESDTSGGAHQHIHHSRNGAG
jgi:2,3-bisphosphoglycerate-dependent phosphoglycerate mutase